MGVVDGEVMGKPGKDLQGVPASQATPPGAQDLLLTREKQLELNDQHLEEPTSELGPHSETPTFRQRLIL
jgi:hypothetical protein